MQNLVFIGSYKNNMNSMHGKYEWYLYVFNIWNVQTNDFIIIEWHMWMFMFNVQKMHSFIQNYITIAQI
jgi:hypothetical protein